MSEIRSDADFRQALSALTVEQQRRIARDFVARVIDLGDNARLKQCLQAAGVPEVSAAELREHYSAAKSIAIETYTLCGREADWARQASHFVAAATAACLAPPEQAEQCRELAWATAMNARMARVCANIAAGHEPDDSEAGYQYGLLERFRKTAYA